MSLEYDRYLQSHISAVNKCYSLLTGKGLLDHDKSKFSVDEYVAYDGFFYGDMTSQAGKEFDFAWNHHQKANPHHWQYWVLINDDNSLECLDMSDRYIDEMVADWGAFAYLAKNGNEIINWYGINRNRIMLSDATREKVESKVRLMAELIDAELSKTFNINGKDNNANSSS